MCYAIMIRLWVPKYKGIYMEPTGQFIPIMVSIVEFKGQWYFSINNSALPGQDWLRSICVDKLYYNPDGTINGKAN